MTSNGIHVYNINSLCKILKAYKDTNKNTLRCFFAALMLFTINARKTLTLTKRVYHTSNKKASPIVDFDDIFKMRFAHHQNSLQGKPHRKILSFERIFHVLSCVYKPNSVPFRVAIIYLGISLLRSSSDSLPILPTISGAKLSTLSLSKGSSITLRALNFVIAYGEQKLEHDLAHT